MNSNSVGNTFEELLNVDLNKPHPRFVDIFIKIKVSDMVDNPCVEKKR